MKETKGQNVETLLEQVHLIQPPKSLDESISELTGRTFQNDYAPQRSFSFSELCGAAIVALLLGGAIGFATAKYKPDVVASVTRSIDTSALFTPAVFNQMHGHSNNPEFVECSACHRFANKEQQQLDKWRLSTFHNPEIRDQFGVPNCKNCHVDSETDLGPNPHSELSELD